MEQKIRWSSESDSLVADLEVEKWFVRSRRLWAAALPLLVAIGAMFDVDPAQLSDLLSQLGEAADRFVAAALSLGGVGMALWTFLRPDHAKLRAKPKPKLPGGGGPAAGAGPFAIALLVALACATTPTARYAQAEDLWADATEAYNGALARDNARVGACLEVATDPEVCAPAIPPAAREQALEVIERGGALLDELGLLVAAPEPDRARIDTILAALERLTLELAIREAQR